MRTVDSVLSRAPGGATRSRSRSGANQIRARHGATLTEVLMSLLIFSIGIVSVFTLFPVSLLSSIWATQVTNSKILVDNVTEIVRSRPSLLLGGEPWQPNREYVSDEPMWVFPVGDPGQLRPDHLLGYRPSVSGMGTPESGLFPPVWPAVAGNNVNDIVPGVGTVTWDTLDTFSASGGGGGTPVFGTVIDNYIAYVIDPLGGDVNGSEFGLDLLSEANGSGHQRKLATHLGFRNASGAADMTKAAEFFTLGDSWTVSTEFVPVSLTSDTSASPPYTDIAVPAGTELGKLNTDRRFTRIVITNPEQTRTVTRNVHGPRTSGQVISVTPNIAAAMNGTVRVETYNSRYSWLATVNRDITTGKVTAECVIFFNRNFSPDAEQLYEYDIDAADQIDVDWAAGNRPILQEGNYVFDSRSCRWHEIVNINEGTNQADITITPPLYGSFTVGTTQGDVMFLPGIITVFEIEL